MRFGPIAVVMAVVSVALAARIDVPVPGSPVPQSLQTLAVVLAGALLGPRRGAGALALYVLAGAAGLPVFAGGTSGVERLTGPTGGFLAGFVAGAAVAGAWMERRGTTRLPDLLPGMLLAHAVILAAGWAWLAAGSGALPAWRVGVAPFLGGSVAKSVAAALILRGLTPSRRDGSPADTPLPDGTDSMVERPPESGTGASR